MKTVPFEHQLREYEEHKDDEARALFWQMRTGKTKAMIDLACYSYAAGRIDGVIVFAPNGVHENWVARQLPVHHWDDVPHSALAWSSLRCHRKYYKAKVDELMDFDGLAWFAFNVESLTGDTLAKKAIAKFVQKRRLLFISDESQDFGTPGSKRTKSGRALTKRCAMRRILSGTPVENSPLKAYSQFELLKPGALGFVSTGKVEDRTYVSGYSHFERKYAEYEEARTYGGRKFPKLVGYKNLEDLRARMADWTSVVLRGDCEDMPDLVYAPRYYEPSRQQAERYIDLYHNSIQELKDGSVSVLEGGVKTLKLQQILSGFYIHPDGEVEILPGPNPRMDAMQEELEFALATRGKAIVWARFQVDIEMIRERLKKMGVKHVEYHRLINREARNRAIDSFQNDPGVEVFLGQPRAGGRGLELSKARTIIRYSYSFDADERRQSEERATVIGGEDIDLIDIVAANWFEDEVPQLIDSYIIESLDGKSDRAEYLSRSGMQAYLSYLVCNAGIKI